ncbi:hypothetical protein D3C86_1724800 [compost metagenome]
MHADHCTGARCQHGADGFRGNVLRFAVYLGEHRYRSGIDDAGYRGEEGAGRHHHLVARAYPQSLERHVQRYGAVLQGDGVFGTGPFGKFLLELVAFLAGPVVDPVGQDDIAYRICLFFREAWPW